MSCYCLLELKEFLKQLYARYPEYDCDLMVGYQNDLVYFKTELNLKNNDSQPELLIYDYYNPGPDRVSFAAMFIQAVATFDKMIKDQKAKLETVRGIDGMKRMTAERKAFIASVDKEIRENE